MVMYIDGVVLQACEALTESRHQMGRQAAGATPRREWAERRRGNEAAQRRREAEEAGISGQHTRGRAAHLGMSPRR